MHTEDDLDRFTQRTIAHYDASAESFWEGTRDHDVRQNIEALLRHMHGAPPLRILDFGCGPGRDLAAFRALGHEAIGLEGSPRFAAMAREHSGCVVWEQDFLALKLPAGRFDGIFANASLFHVPRQELPRVLSELSNASVVHFAGHAISNPTNPLLSRLVLNAGVEGGSDLYAYELLEGRDLVASLVVLAACRSGYSASGATDDDGVLALARPFLARGAKAVVASLWDVADRHSVPLMTRLHRRVSMQPPSAAWRDAALESIAAGEPVLAGWGAYALFLGRDGLSARPHAAERSTTGETR